MLDASDAETGMEVTYEYRAANGTAIHESTDEVVDVERETDEDGEVTEVNVYLDRWYDDEETVSAWRLNWDADSGHWDLQTRQEYNDGETVSWSRVNEEKFCNVRTA